jgi:hypothetical protein
MLSFKTKQLDEKAPPGMKALVKGFKADGMDDDKAFALAWSIYNKKNEEKSRDPEEDEGYVEDYISEKTLSNGVSATDMEAVIVVAFNGGWSKAKDTFGLDKATYDLGKTIAKNIAKDIKSATNAPANSMIHFGSGVGKLNPAWLGSNGTPKTDLYSTAGINISLKQAGGSQVMSGYKEETLSTFNAAISSMGDNAPKEINKLMKELEPVLKKITVPGNVNTIIKSIKDKNTPKGVRAKVGSSKRTLNIKFNKKDYEAKKAEIIDWKAAMKALNPVFNDFFEENLEFRKFFVYEAATGEFKFAPDKYANSNWMVVFDPISGTDNNIVQLSLGKNKPAPYIDTLASKVKVRISPKTPTGSKVSAKGTASTVGSFRLTNDSVDKETFSGLLIKEQEKFNQELLTEEYLTEAKLFAKLKGWLSKLFRTVMKKMQQIAKKGYQAMMAYFEYEPESVDTTGLQLFGFK